MKNKIFYFQSFIPVLFDFLFDIFDCNYFEPTYSLPFYGKIFTITYVLCFFVSYVIVTCMLYVIFVFMK